MKTIGVGSPLVTLFEVAGGVSDFVDLVTRIHKSKVEIGRILGQADYLTARLHQIEVLELLNVERSIISSTNQKLQTLITSFCSAKQTYVEARAFCMGCEQDQKSKVKRLAWLTNNGKQKQWDMIAIKLQQAENSFMQLLNWYAPRSATAIVCMFHINSMKERNNYVA
jgi:hypothetical protein